MTAIAQLELVRNEKESAVDLLLESIKDEKEQELFALFGTERGDLKISSSEVALKVAEADGYVSERASIRFSSFYGEELKASFSAYSSNDVKISIAVGQFAELCEQVSEKAIKVIKAIDEKHKPALMALQSESRDLNRAIRELERAVAAKEKEQTLEKLKSAEGISFDLPEDYWKQPKLTIRFDCEVNNVTNLKVVGQTASGKSLKVEITQKWLDINGNERFNVRKETVRATNVENFLKEASKYVAA